MSTSVINNEDVATVPVRSTKNTIPVMGLRAACAARGVTVHVDRCDRGRIPRTGACIVVIPSHADGPSLLAVVDELSRIRPDVRIFADTSMVVERELRGHVLAVSGEGEVKAALHWLKDGGLLIINLGENAEDHLFASRRRVTACAHEGANLVIRGAGAPVVPARISVGYKGLCLRHRPHLLRALLRVEEVRLPGLRRAVCVRFGNAITPARLATFSDDTGLDDYLRFRCGLLANRVAASNGVRGRSNSGVDKGHKPVIQRVNREFLVREIGRLPSDQLLLERDSFQVFYANASQIPYALREIGRLREVTFRAVGEGTGRRIDLDDADTYYCHLFIWDAEAREIVGAYRLGLTDKILASRGIGGMYTSRLYRYRPELFDALNPGIELGRSFVQEKYQRQYRPLMMLWKGIGEFVRRHPHYKVLYGAVSTSNDYSRTSRHMIADVLKRRYMDEDLSELVRARNPLSPSHLKHWNREDVDRFCTDLDELSSWISDLEGDQAGIPILIKQYEKLGGKFLAFNVDPNFADSLDSLVVVDLTDKENPYLRRFLG